MWRLICSVLALNLPFEAGCASLILTIESIFTGPLVQIQINLFAIKVTRLGNLRYLCAILLMIIAGGPVPKANGSGARYPRLVSSCLTWRHRSLLAPGQSRVSKPLL